ncbi:DNA recombination protein RmuC [Treponema sp.]|uniref:DNA recombination protein RmuC n=1 Tax=Treponema sp. TaxID=166 RepID=UPI00388EF404
MTNLNHIVIAACIFVSFISVLSLILLILRTSSDSSKNSLSLINSIQQKLGFLEASANQIQELGKDMHSLQNILNAPKLRANFGEYLLYNLLKDTIPAKHYEQQYHFSDGSAVDAVLKLGNHLVPIDSKFPLESFNRYINSENPDAKKKAKTEFAKSVKLRVDEIAKKYIRPLEHTFDFAFMYIPSESVYYEILTNDSIKQYELFEYAMENKVIFVSPNTFYSYLLSIVYGLNGFKIEEKAEAIIDELSSLRLSCNDMISDFEVLGKHLANAQAKFSETMNKAQKITAELNHQFLK